MGGKILGVLLAVVLLEIFSGSFALAEPIVIKALVNITSPLDGAQFTEGTVFNVTVAVTCSKDKCANTRVTISLPPGLSLPSNDAVHSLGNINVGKVVKTSWRVSADTAGHYTITVASNSTTRNSQPHSDSVSIVVPVIYFDDDVESGWDGWSATGLWHLTERRNSSPTHSWWYGNETTGTYQTFGELVMNGSIVKVPTRNFGDLISPPIDIRSATSPVLTFQNYWYTELGTTWDTKKVFISTDEGATWIEVFQHSTNPMVWERITVDLSSFAGNIVRLRFSFDTVDGRMNSREGWFIDDVVVKQ